MRYQTPAGGVAGEPEREGGLYRATVQSMGGAWHEVVVIKEEDGAALCSGSSFFGWVPLARVVRYADDD